MLTIKNLSKTYSNSVKALDEINLSIDAGMFGLLGPNGAGKSSLMRTIATLQMPSSGQIEFAGQDVIANPQALRPHLGYLPQEFGVYPKVSAVDLLNHLGLLKGLSDTKARKRQIDTLLALTNLTQHSKKAVSTYSGGMKQRFGIAQALLGSPRLLIVDEPTAGLDPQERNRFHNLLSDVSENTAVILSTHIVEDVSNLCPNMAIVNNGQIIKQGRPSELIEQVSGTLWRKQVSKQDIEQHLAQYNVISQRLVAGRAEIHVLATHQPSSEFEPLTVELEDAYFAYLNLANKNQLRKEA